MVPKKVARSQEGWGPFGGEESGLRLRRRGGIYIGMVLCKSRVANNQFTILVTVGGRRPTPTERYTITLSMANTRDTLGFLGHVISFRS